MKITKTWTTYFLALLMLLVLVFPSCGLTAYADETDEIYTYVLDDLSTDENFTTDDYPEDLEDYSLSVIQIAESSDGELFVYVYQPSGQSIDLRASYINMAQSNNAEDTTLFSLTYLNSYETLYKYMVDDITFSTDTLRYYNIISIYREFIEDVDEESDYESQEITYVSYVVGKMWTAYSVSTGDVDYYCYETETIEITDKYVGYVYYDDGFSLISTGACHSHFIAFATDHEIDKLMSATVYYTYQSYNFTFQNYEYIYTYGDKISDTVYLTCDELVSHTGSGYWASTYTWERIQDADSFVESVEDEKVYEMGLFDVSTRTQITDEELIEALDGMQYVLRFLETSYSYTSYSQYYMVTEYTIVGDVSILQLTFETDGVVYSLGVVDNMQTGSEEPVNETYTEYDWSDWLKNLVEWLSNNWQYIVIGIACVIVLIICAPFIPSILSFIVQAVRWLFKGIWWIIQQIAKGFVGLFKGIWWLIQQIAKGIMWVFTSVTDIVDNLTK